MAFDFTLTTDKLLYRSVKIREKLLGEWYCFIPEHTFGYGSITGEFKSTKTLKLLDITKNSFYNDFRDKIIDYSKLNTFINTNKIALLFPLGFSDLTLYNKFADKIQIPRVSTIDLSIELDTQYYGNRSRCSVIQLDLQLILVLKEIYPDYDGIISPVHLPNILSNGYQHSEMCIFDTGNIRLIKEIPRMLHIGGNMNPTENIKIVGAINIDNEFTREYTKSMQEFSKTFKPLQTNSIIEPNKSDINKLNTKYRKTRKQHSVKYRN